MNPDSMWAPCGMPLFISLPDTAPTSSCGIAFAVGSRSANSGSRPHRSWNYEGDSTGLDWTKLRLKNLPH